MLQIHCSPYIPVCRRYGCSRTLTMCITQMRTSFEATSLCSVLALHRIRFDSSPLKFDKVTASIVQFGQELGCTVHLHTSTHIWRRHRFDSDFHSRGFSLYGPALATQFLNRLPMCLGPNAERIAFAGVTRLFGMTSLGSQCATIISQVHGSN